MQDVMNSKLFSNYDNGKIRRATKMACEGLERAAVWEPEHVEERLRDLYVGKPNIWVEQLKIKD